MDIAVALGDADLVSVVERLTDPDAVATLIGPDTHQRWHDTIVEHAVSLLSGGDYWGPRRPCPLECPPSGRQPVQRAGRPATDDGPATRAHMGGFGKAVAPGLDLAPDPSAPRRN